MKGRTTKAAFGMMAMMLSIADPGGAAQAASFGEDVDFLRRHKEVVLLKDGAGAGQVAVVPGWQGRVMTSTARGAEGASFGWVNRDLIASGKVEPHINVFGGEDRFWLGPEGGQFSIFFAKDVPFDLAHWFTPAALDTEPFPVISRTDQNVVCRRRFGLTNYSGARFELEVTREVRLIQPAEWLQRLGIPLPSGVRSVGFESVNTVRNLGTEPWRKATGLLSIWILGMFNASPAATVVIPFEPGDEAARGPVVNDTYFGKVPADRLRVKEGALCFRADAGYRSKIGIAPRRARPRLGSYDASAQVLTLVEFTLPEGVTDYVDSMWKFQDDPFGGDVVNSYNDGPAQAGEKQLGEFYELETSSPALALAPNESRTHVHRTLHLEGSDDQLKPVARAALGLGLAEIQAAFR